jgi:hypothetical protein
VHSFEEVEYAWLEWMRCIRTRTTAITEAIEGEAVEAIEDELCELSKLHAHCLEATMNRRNHEWKELDVLSIDIEPN